MVWIRAREYPIDSGQVFNDGLPRQALLAQPATTNTAHNRSTRGHAIGGARHSMSG